MCSPRIPYSSPCLTALYPKHAKEESHRGEDSISLTILAPLDIEKEVQAMCGNQPDGEITQGS